jgi:hypothetical protein
MPRPRKPRESRRIPLAVYAPPGVLRRLRAVAAKDRRSLSTQALILIEDGLKSRKA